MFPPNSCLIVNQAQCDLIEPGNIEGDLGILIISGTWEAGAGCGLEAGVEVWWLCCWDVRNDISWVQREGLGVMSMQTYQLGSGRAGTHRKLWAPPQIRSLHHQQRGDPPGAFRNAEAQASMAVSAALQFLLWLKDNFSGFKIHVLPGHDRTQGAGDGISILPTAMTKENRSGA